MAGKGERFVRAGYDRPKPLIDVDGRPMVERVLECLPTEANYVFLVPGEPAIAMELEAILAAIRPNSTSLRVNHVTEGAACTVLLAEGHVRPWERIIVANCDQLVSSVDWDSTTYSGAENDGFVLTFPGTGPKWSYAIPDEDGSSYASSFVEKRQVGRLATCGVYGVSRASKLFEAIRKMIACDDRVNGEFYLCPALNYVQGSGSRPLFCIVSAEMVGLGTPEDLEAHTQCSGSQSA